MSEEFLLGVVFPCGEDALTIVRGESAERVFADTIRGQGAGSRVFVAPLDAFVHGVVPDPETAAE